MRKVKRDYIIHTYITIMTPPFWWGFYRSLKEIIVGTFGSHTGGYIA